MGNELLTVEYRKEGIGCSYKYNAEVEHMELKESFKYFAEIKHRGLKEYKVFSSYDDRILQNKVNAYVSKLNIRWNSIASKENAIKIKESLIKESSESTHKATSSLQKIERILLDSIDVKYSFNWENYKDKTKYSKSSPIDDIDNRISKLATPRNPVYTKYTIKPKEIDYQPKLNFFEFFSKAKKENKIQIAKNNFENALNIWKNNCGIIDIENIKKDEEFAKKNELYNNKVTLIKQTIENEVREWERNKEMFIVKQNKKNESIDEFKKNYLKRNKNEVAKYCKLLLEKSEYPISFKKRHEIDYNPENKLLIVEYSLPTLENFPTLKEVKFINNEFKEIHISEAQLNKLFDDTMYNIALRTINELFVGDKAQALDTITFNGWNTAINKSNGKEETNCIISIQVRKNEFLDINLKHVDPKACFKKLKGVGSSKLISITAIQPIMQINRNDKRFVNSHDVANSINEGYNIAIMDWQDFEHLIREIFEKEFSTNGGEVKVTQASRDGGVDAIAFDPDPIRGGKIVIQAKRYTNTVGVAAVRDLYGTVHNEGATKGILVTTADYGPDAYEFAKGKPITLLNGSNLLHLLEKHGHKARIDIKEAKRFFKEDINPEY